MLEVKKINVFYDDAQALWDISFTVCKGEIVTLVGSNGSGKSTTLKAISGLVPPSSGEISLEETRIDRMAAHRIVERGIAQIPEGRRLWPGLSVRENLELGAYTKSARAVRAQTMEWVLGLFPLLKIAHESACGNPFRGGAADARHRQGAPFLPQIADPGRAVARVGAVTGGGGV